MVIGNRHLLDHALAKTKLEQTTISYADEKAQSIVKRLMLEGKRMGTVENENLKKTKFLGVDTKIDGRLVIIQLNAPQRKNALTPSMYAGITNILKEAANNPNISMVAITGTGDFYSSGNDFGVLMGKGAENEDSLSGSSGAQKGLTMVKNFVDMLIDFPKPIIAVLNGPAVGIAVTSLALMDAVYASDKAWLHTPFTQLGLCPEGCSSFTFPRLMGSLKASELLLFGKKISSNEAHELGLVTQVFPAFEFDSLVWPKLKEMAELPPTSLMYGKQLCRDIDKEQLHQINEAELKKLTILSQSEETAEAMFKWFSRKSKL